MLSDRLEYIIKLAGSGDVIADIGTDHGFVPVELVRRNCFRRGIAADIGRGPLSRAEEHIRTAGLKDRIETRLSDGLQRFTPGEADTIVIAGMGGLLVTDILKRGAAAAQAARQLILSPQSEYEDFRAYLDGSGYEVLSETWIKEDGKYYVIFRVHPGKQSICDDSENGMPESCCRKTMQYTAAELSFGRTAHLDARSRAVRAEYLAHERQTVTDLMGTLEKLAESRKQENGADTHLQTRIRELQMILDRIETVSEAQ